MAGVRVLAEGGGDAKRTRVEDSQIDTKTNASYLDPVYSRFEGDLRPELGTVEQSLTEGVTEG